MEHRLAELIDGLCSTVGELAGQEEPLLPGCTAAREMSEAEAKQHLRVAYYQGGIHVEVARQSLAGLAVFLRLPELVFPVWNCGRTALEASALASWLLDPDLGGTERLARSLGLRWKEVKAQATLAREVDDSAVVRKADRTIQKLRRLAEANGVSVVLKASGGLKRLGTPPPSFTDLVKEQFDDAASYRILSSLVHGNLWSLIQLAMREVGTGGFGEASGGGQFLEMKPSAHRVGVSWLAEKAIAAFGVAVESQFTVMGWDHKSASTEVTLALSALRGLRKELLEPTV